MNEQQAGNEIVSIMREMSKRFEAEQFIDASIGIIRNGVWSIQYKDGKLDFPSVTLSRAAPFSESYAFNGSSGVPLKAGAPIRLRENPSGSVPYEIVGVQGAAGEQFFAAGNAGVVSAHTHTEDSGSRYVHPARDFSAGRVQVMSTGASLSVEVFNTQNRFHYKDGTGADAYYNGGSIDLTSNVPGSGLCRMVKVCLDPTTGDLVAVNGSTMASAMFDFLGEDDSTAIAVTDGYYPLAAIRLKNGRSIITEADIFDIRQFVIASGSGGGSGTVTSVSATATPTSVFGIAVTDPTTTPAIALTMDNQTGNTVLASPADGSSGQPAFRALVVADLPNMALIAGGRLTLSSGIPVTTSDVTAATTLYYAPYLSNVISLYDGVRWNNHTFTQLSLALSLDRHRLYDIYVYNNSGTLTLETQAWSAPTTATITNVTNVSTPTITTSANHGLSIGQLITIHGVVGATGVNNNSTDRTWRINTVPTLTTFTIVKNDNSTVSAPGAYTSGGTVTYADSTATRLTDPVLQDGVYLKTGSLTRRYLGTIRGTYAANECEDSLIRRFVWNYNNRLQRALYITDDTDSWSYGTAAWRATNNSMNNRVQVIVGISEDLVRFDHVRRSLGASFLGVSVNGFADNDARARPTSGSNVTYASNYLDYLSAGYSYLQLTERTTGTATTFFGDGGAAANELGAGIGAINA